MPPFQHPAENYEQSLPDNDGEAFASFVISELECPVCLKAMIGEMNHPRICSNGHLCCNVCANQLASCPCCRVVGTWKRCIALEKLGEWIMEQNYFPPPSLKTVTSFDWELSGPPPRYFLERGLSILKEISEAENEHFAA